MALDNLDKCCCCIDLKTGAYILGALACVCTGWGIIELILFFIEFGASSLGFAFLVGAYALGAIGFIRLLGDPNSKEKKDQFAELYLYSICIGSVLNFVINMIYGLFLFAFIATAIDVAIQGYFWLCVRSYAQAHDRMMQQQPGQVVVVQQQDPASYNQGYEPVPMGQMA